MENPPLHIMLLAGESSGDFLGAALMRSLRDLAPDTCFSGAGGPQMEAQGLQSVFPITDISVMGPWEILPRLPLIFKRIRQMTNHALESGPDAIVIIDSPDFTHRVARRISRRAPNIPVINYVSPTVWAWRRGRARAMAQYLERVLALLPFEPGFFKTQAGLDCIYVGHPAIEHIPPPEAGKSFRHRHFVSADERLLLVLPGSRMNEVKRLIPLFGRVLQHIHNKVHNLKVVLPVLPHLRDAIDQAVKNWPLQPVVIEGDEEKWAAFRAADAAIATSGTVSLELGLACVPMVIVYQTDRLAGWLLSRLLRVPSVVLPNLILDRPAVQELLQDEATPDRVASAVLPLLSETPQRARALRDFQEMSKIMEVGGEAPGLRAARAVLEVLHR